MRQLKPRTDQPATSSPLAPVARPPLGPIDDLTKYRIVELLFGAPAGGEASFIARSLGFHSVGLTERALAELVDAEICDVHVDGDANSYRLAPSALTRAEIQQLHASRDSGHPDPELLRGLATQSLRRARQRARAGGAGDHPADLVAS